MKHLDFNRLRRCAFAFLQIQDVPIGLENALELSQEPLRSIPSSTLAHLDIDWGFVRLNVASANQLSPHRGDHGDQQFADLQNPAVQRRSTDFQASVSFQDHALPMQGCVIAIFADDRVDDDPVTPQAFLNDPWRQGR